jgi:hypothetical protein
LASLRRWAVRLGAGGLIAVASALGTAASIGVCPCVPPPPVPLTVGLHGRWDEISEEFDRRVRERFPLGSSEVEMAMELRHESFSREDWTAAPDLDREAVRHEDGFVCHQSAHIYWHADSLGRLSAISGVYRPDGCL